MLKKVIITLTFHCDNLWKSKFMALEKPGKLREFFSPTLWPPWIISPCSNWYQLRNCARYGHPYDGKDRPFCFTAVVDIFFLFSPPNPRVRLADHHQTLPHGWWWPRFMKFGEKFGWPLPLKFGGPKHQISAWFRTTSWLDREYLPNATRNHQLESSIANYGHSGTGKINMVYFGSQ